MHHPPMAIVALSGAAREHARRDAGIIAIHEGTGDIRRLVIARNETGPR